MSRSPRPNTQRNVALFVVLITAAAALGWFFLAQQPALEQVANLETELRTADTELSQAQQIVRALPELRASVTRLQETRSAFLRQLPSTRDVADVIDTLHVAATRSNVVLTNVNQGGGQGGISGVAPIGFSLNASGTWANILFFLNHLENLQQFTKIHNVSVSGGGGRSLEPDLTVSFNLSVYTLTDAGALP